MSVIEAIILGVVQGLTEFLPVSSSGHLQVVSFVMEKFFAGDGLAEGDLFFELLVHLASAIAAFIFFYRQIVSAFKKGNRRILLLIVGASIPAAVLGLVFKKLEIIDGIKGAPVIVAICFFITAALLKISDYAKDKDIGIKDAGWGKALLIGVGQAVALLPGISRSGATISTGLLAGLKRRDAVVFSFLLGIPAILGANLVDILLKLAKHEAIFTEKIAIAPAIAGFVASLAVSLVCIKILVVMVRRRMFSVFSWYLLAAGTATIILILI